MPSELLIYMITLLLTVIGVFLLRLLHQIDQLTNQFRDLIEIVAVVKTALVEHKGDVLVIKEQINNHTQDIKDMNLLFDRIRIVENELTGIKASRTR